MVQQRSVVAQAVMITVVVASEAVEVAVVPLALSALVDLNLLSQASN